MILVRLGSLCARNSSLSHRFLPRTGALNFCSKSEKAGDVKPIKIVENEDDHPVVYSKTKAYTHLAKHTRYRESNFPEYQGSVIIFSLSVFMVYFFILREENDIDAMLGTPLENRIPNITKTVNKG